MQMGPQEVSEAGKEASRLGNGQIDQMGGGSCGLAEEPSDSLEEVMYGVDVTSVLWPHCPDTNPLAAEWHDHSALKGHRLQRSSGRCWIVKLHASTHFCDL